MGQTTGLEIVERRKSSAADWNRNLVFKHVYQFIDRAVPAANDMRVKYLSSFHESEFEGQLERAR